MGEPVQERDFVSLAVALGNDLEGLRTASLHDLARNIAGRVVADLAPSDDRLDQHASGGHSFTLVAAADQHDDAARGPDGDGGQVQVRQPARLVGLQVFREVGLRDFYLVR